MKKLVTAITLGLALGSTSLPANPLLAIARMIIPQGKFSARSEFSSSAFRPSHQEKTSDALSKVATTLLAELNSSEPKTSLSEFCSWLDRAIQDGAHPPLSTLSDEAATICKTTAEETSKDTNLETEDMLFFFISQNGDVELTQHLVNALPLSRLVEVLQLLGYKLQSKSTDSRGRMRVERAFDIIVAKLAQEDGSTTEPQGLRPENDIDELD